MLNIRKTRRWLQSVDVYVMSLITSFQLFQFQLFHDALWVVTVELVKSVYPTTTVKNRDIKEREGRGHAGAKKVQFLVSMLKILPPPPPPPLVTKR